MKRSPVIDDLYSIQTAVTPIQSGEFNCLLTNISACVKTYQLENTLPLYLSETENEFQISHSPTTIGYDDIQHNWQLLLNYVYEILLPEVYVFFHDDTCTTAQRKEIHHQLDMILRQFRRWIQYSPVQIQMINQNRQNSHNATDDYIIGKGQNANVACLLIALAKLSNIHGDRYLDDMMPLTHVLITEDKLTEFLSQDSQEVLYQLDHWLKQRMTHFSQPSKEALQGHSQLLCVSKHPLISHIQHNFDGKLLAQDKDTQLICDATSINNHHTNDTNSTSLTVNSSLDDSNNLFKTTGMFAIPLAIMVLGFFVVSGIASILFIGIGILATLGLLASILVRRRKASLKDVTPQPFKLKDSINKPIDSPQKNIVINSLENNRINIILPISINRHAYHLTQLIAEGTLEDLKSLITAINETYGYLEYLEEHHPYLATSVHELIMDISVNTITCLNQQAQTFVKKGTVSDDVKAMFASQYESNIARLLNNHLAEILALNKSILAKQMTGFAHVGSDSERQFRDAVMELKILLNWFVAQAEDGGICGYTMMQQKLESDMLVKMQEAYYKKDITAEQQAELQRQVDELLDYFKAQSPSTEHGLPTDGMLQLTDEHNVLDTVFNQSETQQFIDFNKHYVKQLKQHW